MADKEDNNHIVSNMDADFRSYTCDNCKHEFAVKKGYVGYGNRIGCPYCSHRMIPMDRQDEIKAGMVAIIDQLHGELGEKLLGYDRSRDLYNTLLRCCQRLMEYIHKL